MKIAKREILVAFGDKKTKKAFEELKKGIFESKKLFEFINRAIDDLKNDPTCGIRIPNKLIPKPYIQKYNVNNLWKYNLPDAWRLIYRIMARKPPLFIGWMSCHQKIISTLFS